MSERKHAPADVPAASALAPMRVWLAGPMEDAAASALERVRRAEDVVRVAVMPDVHVAGDVCVGTAMATRRLIYPSAVGGDIGCGMLALAFDGAGAVVRDPARAGAVLRLLAERIPAQRRHRARAASHSDDLNPELLSDRSLAALAREEGRLQLGTLGGGNHFVELQADESDRLWVMIHSGSRVMGQAIKEHHAARATIGSGALKALDADTPAGQAYLNDQAWARRLADANRRTMGREAAEALRELLSFEAVDSMTIACDHNHVARETHFGQTLYVHRKGAMAAEAGVLGVVPGSMGTLSVHVEGRGCADALRSGAHGAGRLLSRSAARRRFGRGDLRRQMQGVWFDPRMAEALREECPAAYKDVRAVMRAQGELVRTIRTLRPILVYKAR